MNFIKINIFLFFLISSLGNIALSGVIPPDGVVSYKKARGRMLSRVVYKLTKSDLLVAAEKRALSSHTREDETFEKLYIAVFVAAIDFFKIDNEQPLETLSLLKDYLFSFSNRQDLGRIRKASIEFKKYGLLDGAQFFGDLIGEIQNKAPAIYQRYSLDILISQGLDATEQARISRSTRNVLNSLRSAEASCGLFLVGKVQKD